MNKRAFTVRPFESADRAAVVKLWSGIASFDGAVPARAPAVVDALLNTPAHAGGRHWRVAVAGNGAIVGALEIALIGSVRTHAMIGTNPAWRRQGVGRALIEQAPAGKRLLVTSRSSSAGASEFLQATGFVERFREARMRRRAAGVDPVPAPDGTRIVASRDPERLRRALLEVFGDDDGEPDVGVLQAQLDRPGCQALFVQIGDDDAGVCVVAGLERAKKGERDAQGNPTVGTVEQVGLSKALRGKGMSRALVRHGLVALQRAGFAELEVAADRRRTSAVELYEAEGFKVVDDDVHWLKKEAG